MKEPPPDTILALHHHLKQIIKNQANNQLETKLSSQSLAVIDKNDNCTLIYIKYSYNPYSVNIFKSWSSNPNSHWTTKIEWTDPQLIQKLEQAILEYQ